MGEESPSLDRVVERVKVGRGTVQRIRDGEAQTRLSSLHAIAAAFRIEVWQLLVPGLNPSSLPRLAEGSIGELEARIARLEAASSGAGGSNQKRHRNAA